MTPTAFYCWIYDQPLVWFGFRRLHPRPDQNFPWVFLLIHPLLALVATLGIAKGICLLVGMNIPFLYLFLGSVSISSSLCHSLFALVSWNQRAARLRTGIAVPALAPARWQRWTLGPIYLLVVALALPLALLNGIENIRGALHWRQVRTKLLAQGERLDVRDLIGPPVPADQNFASLPLFADLLKPEPGSTQRINTNAMARVEVFRLPDYYLPTLPKGEHRTFTLEEWAAAFQQAVSNQNTSLPKAQRSRAERLPAYPVAPTGSDTATIILTALQVAEAERMAICEASQRPYYRVDRDWAEGFNILLPELAQMKGIQRHLLLRIRALLAKGDTHTAFTETLCALRLADRLATEPLLISQLVRIAQGTIGDQAVWAGIITHSWTDSQLQEFQKRVVQPDYFAGMALALEGERDVCREMMERWAQNPDLLRREARGISLDDGTGGEDGFGNIAFQSVVLDLMPTGWVRQQQANLALFHQAQIDGVRPFAAGMPMKDWGRTLKELDDRNVGALEQLRKNPSPYTALVPMLIPALSKATHKAARGQFNGQCTATACALERYWIQKRQYPESLSALVPEFLPTPPIDPMDGQPLRYERTPNGQFRLWSIGDDGKDDRGQRVKGAQVDWAWPLDF